MAKSSKGRNAGVTGLFDFAGTPTFTMRVARFSRQQGAAAVVRTKRGDAWRRIKQTTPGGQLLVWGTVRKDGFPEPEKLKGASGSVVLNLGGDAKQTLAVTVLSSKIDHDDESEDEWQIALVAEVTANPAYAGFGGSQTAAAADPSLDAVQTHEGASKTYDPDGLQDADTVRIDVDGLTDTDAGEVSWITSYVAAFVATRAGMKVRNAQFARTDHWGGSMVVSLARTTSAEDVINAATSKTIDPNNLASQAATAAINGTPPTPTGASFLSRGTTTKELNDGNILSTSDWGLNSTKTDAQNARTHRQTDAAAIEQGHDIGVVYAAAGSPTPPSTPAGMVLLDYDDVPLNPEETVRIYRYAFANRQTAMERARYELVTDANTLKSAKQTAAVWDTAGSAPSTPTAPAGLKLVDYRDVGIDSHPTKVCRVYRWGLTDSKDDIELPESEVIFDPEGLDSRQRTTHVYVDGDGDTPPATPVGLTPDTQRFQQLNGVMTKVAYGFDVANSRQKIEFPGTFLKTDASALDDERHVTTVTNAATLAFPGTVAASVGVLYLRDTRPTQLTASGLYRHEAVYGRQTRDDEQTNGHAVSEAFADQRQRDVTVSLPSGTVATTVNLGGTWTASVTPSGLLSDTADAIYTAVKNDPTFDRAEVRKLHNSKLLIQVHRQGRQWELELESQTFGDLMTPYRLTVTGVVQVYLEDRLQVDATNWVYRLADVPTRCTLMRLTLWKVYSGDTLYAYLPSAGVTNASAFFGMSARCVTYAGIQGRVRVRDAYRLGNLGVAAFEGPRRIGHKFVYDSRGIVASGAIVTGSSVWTTTDLSALSRGDWVNASALGITASGAALGDFDTAFLDTTP